MAVETLLSLAGKLVVSATDLHTTDLLPGAVVFLRQLPPELPGAAVFNPLLSHICSSKSLNRVPPTSTTSLSLKRTSLLGQSGSGATQYVMLIRTKLLPFPLSNAVKKLTRPSPIYSFAYQDHTISALLLDTTDR